MLLVVWLVRVDVEVLQLRFFIIVRTNINHNTFVEVDQKVSHDLDLSQNHGLLNADSFSKSGSISFELLSVLFIDHGVLVLEAEELDLFDAVGEFLAQISGRQIEPQTELLGVGSIDRINIADFRFVAHLDGELEARGRVGHIERRNRQTVVISKLLQHSSEVCVDTLNAFLVDHFVFPLIGWYG